MRRFGTVVGLLRGVVNRIRNQFSTGDAIASQFVRHNFPRLTNDDSTFNQHVFDVSVTKVEPIVQPDSVLNDFGWKSVAFVRIIGCAYSAIVAQWPLICEYPAHGCHPIKTLNQTTVWCGSCEGLCMPSPSTWIHCTRKPRPSRRRRRRCRKQIPWLTDRAAFD